MAELHRMRVYAQLHWRWNFYGIGLPHIALCFVPPLFLMASVIMLEEFFQIEAPMGAAFLSVVPIMAFVGITQYEREPNYLLRRFLKRSVRRWSSFAKGPVMPPFPVPRSSLERKP